MLLDAGAKPDIVSDDGDTALHLASQLGGLEIIRVLLDRRAPINLKGFIGVLIFDNVSLLVA